MLRHLFCLWSMQKSNAEPITFRWPSLCRFYVNSRVTRGSTWFLPLSSIGSPRSWDVAASINSRYFSMKTCKMDCSIYDQWLQRELITIDATPQMPDSWLCNSYNPFCGILCSSLATYTSEHDVRGTTARTSTSDAVEAVACSTHLATLQMNRETRSTKVGRERECKSYNCALIPICLWTSLILISIFIRFQCVHCARSDWRDATTHEIQTHCRKLSIFFPYGYSHFSYVYVSQIHKKNIVKYATRWTYGFVVICWIADC